MIIRAIPLLGLILALSFSSSAALITGVTIEDFSTEYPNRSAVDSINGTGLSGGLHNNGANDMWLSNNEELPLITFDLEGNYDVANFHVWNYNEAANLNAGAQAVEIYVSPDGSTANLVKLDNAGGDWVFPQAPGTNGYVGFDIDFGGVTNAALLNNVRLLRFNILSSYGSGASLVGLSEVRFTASSSFSITSVTPNTDGGLGGSVTNNGSNVTYDPNGQFNSLNDGQTATDTFSYTITGGSSVTVTVTITGVSRGTVVRFR